MELKEKELCKYCDAINICTELDCIPLDGHDPVLVEIICPIHKYKCDMCQKRYNNKQALLCDEYYCQLVCIRESGEIIM